MMTQKLIVYSKPNCPWCSLVLHVIDIAGLPVSIEKLESPEVRRFFIEELQKNYNTTQSTFPVVFVDDASDFLIGGCIETIEWLNKNNYKTTLI